MIKLTDVELRNVVYFKEAKLDITRHPLTIISGRNKDSRISTETSNGAGKSLVLSVVPNLRYDQTPLATSKNRKDMLTSSAASITLSFVGNDNAAYTVTQTSSKIVIERDGKDLELRTLPLQRKRLEEIFPISENEFYSYVYLQSQRPLSFQNDKPASRLHYITEIFRLDVYDRLKKFFTKKLGEIKSKQVEFDVINNQLIKVNGLLERLQWSKDKAEQLEAARGIISTLGKDAKTLQSRIEKLKAALAVCDQYDKLRKQRKKLKPAISAKEARAELQLHDELREYESDMASYNAQVKQLTEQLAELGKPKNRAKLEKQLKGLQKLMVAEEKVLEQEFEKRQKAKALREKADDAAKDVLAAGGKLKKAEMTAIFGTKIHEDNLLKYQAVMQLESIVDDCADGECPTCQQSVNIKKFKKQLAEAREGVKHAKQQIRLIEACAAYVTAEAKASKIDFDEEAFVARRDGYRAAAAETEKLEAQLEIVERIDKLTARLGKLKQPKPPKTVPSHTRKQLAEILEQHSELHRINSLIESLESQHGTLDKDALSNKLDATSARYAKIERKYIKAQDVVSTLGSKASEYKVLRRERKDAIEKLAALEPIIAQRDLYKSLEKAYAKDLKVYAANQVLSQIEQNLNRYSNLIFAEPFKFSVYADDKGVHCMVDRGHGKKSDVRLLSGAESDAFRLLFFWVMLIMVEDERRTNFAVLDEADAHMDETTQALFIERFLPALRTLVPNIFVITPKDRNLYSECAYLTVVKHKGQSKVVED